MGGSKWDPIPGTSRPDHDYNDISFGKDSKNIETANGDAIDEHQNIYTRDLAL